MHVYFSETEQQVVLGSVLGGSSLVQFRRRGNYCLSMRGTNSMWLRYKMQQMPGCFPTEHLTPDKKTFRCNSVCSEVFTQMYNLLYQEGKRKITEEILDRLKDTGMAIWFVDGGGIQKNQAYFKIHRFGEQATIIQHYFNNILEVPCDIKARRLEFSQEGTEKLLRLVGYRLPEFILKEM